MEQFEDRHPAGQEKNLNDIEEKFYKSRLESLRERKEHIKTALIETHKYDPKYIFLTETSSIPAGYLLKSGLETAFPEGGQPDFYRINPAEVMKVMVVGQSRVDAANESEAAAKARKKDIDEYLKFGGQFADYNNEEIFQLKKAELENFFENRIKEKEAKILVYDLDWNTGTSPGSIVALLKNPERYGLSRNIKSPNVKMNLPESDMQIPWREEKLKTYRNINFSRASIDLNLSKNDILPIPGHITGLPNANPRITAKNPREAKQAGIRNFRAKIGREGWDVRTKNNEVKKIDAPKAQLLYIKALKDIGKEIGEEIRKELESA